MAMQRRRFLQNSLSTAAAGFAISGTKFGGRVLGANDRIRVGVAGINNRGRSHYRSYAGMNGVEVACLIDPDARLFDSRRKDCAERQGGREPNCLQDVREALEDQNLDAISIATCNHWHSLMTIWACQAGKDVYVEKPLSHNVHEGRIAVEAARKYNRIVQHGTQRRSNSSWRNTIAAVRSGKYGKLEVSKGYCCKPRWSIGRKPFSRPPEGLDFNVWLGPAPDQRYHGNLVHYNWHWFWDFGNGDIGNQGVHQMDIARWAIGGSSLPKRAFALGGRFAYEDQGQTANTQLAVYEYDEALLLFEVRGLVGDKSGMPRRVTNEFYTTEGVITRGQFRPHGSDKAEPLEDFETENPGGHFENFIDAMRSRKKKDQTAPVEYGHYASALCHLGNISYRLGERRSWDGELRAFGDNPRVRESVETVEKNLEKAGLTPKGTPYRSGRVLEFDPQQERFVNDDEANVLLSRPYRKPFVVPEKLT